LAEAWFTATSLAIEASHFIQSWQVELRGEAHHRAGGLTGNADSSLRVS
jgi:hypothetical protein